MPNVYDAFTYEDYLDSWEERFGDDLEGTYGYWLRGQHRPYPVRKLSKSKFETHRAALSAADDAFQKAIESGDHQAIEDTSNSIFPHDLELLL